MIATCLYTACSRIQVRSCFKALATHFRAGAELVLAGADPASARAVFTSGILPRRCVAGRSAFQSALRWEVGVDFGIPRQMEQCQAKERRREGLVITALSIQDVEVAAFFRELSDGRFRVSMRSKGVVERGPLVASVLVGAVMNAPAASRSKVPLSDAVARRCSGN